MNLLPLDILPPDVQQATLKDYPQKMNSRIEPFADNTNVAEPTLEFALALLQRAIDEEIEKEGSRNAAGLWLACQLRDNGFSAELIYKAMRLFKEHAPDTNARGEVEEYTYEEAEATARSAIEKQPRSPWKAHDDKPIGSYPIRYVADAFTQEEQQPWLIQNMLRQKMSGIFYGSESTCKSGIAVSLALHVAYGLDMWYGKKIEQGIVAIVAGEGEYDIELLEHAFIQDYESNHSDVTLSRDTKNFILIPTGVPIDNEKAVDALIAQLKVELNGRQLSLLFFDTLTTCLEKANPDQNVDMMRVGRYLRHIQEELHCATIIVTHTGHNQAHVRGASDITRGADATWKMEHDIFSDIYTLTIEKIKGQERKKDIMCFRQKIIMLSTQDNFGEFETGYVLELDPFVTAPSLQKIFDTQQIILDILTDEGALNNTHLQAACKEEGISQRKYEAMRDKLIERGTIVCEIGDKNAHVYSVSTSANDTVLTDEDENEDEETCEDP
jgi:hypothetical protein